MKKHLLCVSLLVCVSAIAGGFKVEYGVAISGSDAVEASETYTVCNDRLRIDTVGGGYILFDRAQQKGWMVDPGRSTARVFSRDRNQAFYNQFLILYGVVTDDGSVLFPDSVFKRLEGTERVGDVDCDICRLPGQFLNSTGYAWLSREAGTLSGEAVAELFSYFTNRKVFLDQLRQLKGFPVRIRTTVNLNGLKTTTTKTLRSAETIDCALTKLVLEDGLKMVEAPPTGIPLASE